MAEAQPRRSLQLSLGRPLVFFETPGSAALLALAAVALSAPFVAKGLNRFKATED